MTKNDMPEHNLADCTPKDPRPFIYAAQSRQDSSRKLIPEAVDNSIDAKSTIINMLVDAKKGPGGSITIEDNGQGVASLAHLMSYGTSTKRHDGETVGRYGVGAKDLIWSVGGLQSTLTAQSASQDSAWLACVRWAEQETFNWPWEKAYQGELTFAGGSKTGTRLEMTNCWKRLPTPAELTADLSIFYWPWLEKPGNVLRINGVQLRAPRAIPTDGRFKPSVYHQFSEGRTATLDGGLTAEQDADSPLNGVTIWAGNRNIYPSSTRGIETRNGIFVLVRLFGPWALETNKQGLVMEQQEELDAWLEEQLADLVADAGKQALHMQLGDDTEAINAMFAGAEEQLTGLPTRPGKGAPDNRIRSKGDKTRGPVKEAAKVDDERSGEAKQRVRQRRKKPVCRIQFMQGTDPESVGAVDLEQQIITLHTNNQVVAMYRAMNDASHRTTMLYTLAACLLANAAQEPDTFSIIFGNILSAAILKASSIV